MCRLDISVDAARDGTKITVGVVRVLHRTASPYHELMQSFGERDVVSPHILTCHETLIHLAQLSGHHRVCGMRWRLSLQASNTPLDLSMASFLKAALISSSQFQLPSPQFHCANCCYWDTHSAWVGPMGIRWLCYHETRAIQNLRK